MNDQRHLPNLRLTSVSRVCQLLLLATLIGCSSDSPLDGAISAANSSSSNNAEVTPTASALTTTQVSSRPSVSASALINDDSSSLNSDLHIDGSVNSVTFNATEPTSSASAVNNTTTPSLAQTTPELGAATPLVSSPNNVTVTNSVNLPEVEVEVEVETETGTDKQENNNTELVQAAETSDNGTVEPTTETNISPFVESSNVSDSQPATTDSADEESSEFEQANVNTTPNSTGFTSHTTSGFAGDLRSDGSVVITWQKDPTARGYNVYRQAQYIDTVFDEQYIDTDIFDESYYYEIQAFDFADNFNYIATGLTVNVNGLNKTNPAAQPTNSGILDNYELVFSDEFNGSELDSSKWNTQYLWGPDLVINSEEQYYVDIVNEPEFGYNPFEFDGESITINSIRTPTSLLEKANNQPYLSGVMTSYDAFKFTYGYVEARAKMPYGDGLWAAFWLLNAYYVDDKPEIDIMEHIGDDQDVVYHTYHYYDADGNLRSSESQPTPGIDYTADFHTLAVEWKPGTIIYYIDGIERHRINDAKVSQQDMYVIANTALGGWWPGSPTETTEFPAKYQIDYIRVYQRLGLQDDPPQFNVPTRLPYADDVPGSAPNHTPPFELWPEGYPERL